LGHTRQSGQINLQTVKDKRNEGTEGGKKKKKRLLPKREGWKGKHILLIPRLFETRVGGDARAKKECKK
jgi:hypothetical protein